MQLENIFTNSEIIKFQKLASILPSHINPFQNVDKYLHFHSKLSPFRSIIEPKIKKIVGNDALVCASAYKECIYPYPLHFDTKEATDFYKNIFKYEVFDIGKIKYNLAFLIPLVEGPNFKTAIFDINDPFENYSEQKNTLSCMKPEWLNYKNDLDLEEYDHLPANDLKNLNNLPLLEECIWKLGSVILWDRNKLHCSSNFAKFDLIKKMIILFIE